MLLIMLYSLLYEMKPSGILILLLNFKNKVYLLAVLTLKKLTEMLILFIKYNGLLKNKPIFRPKYGSLLQKLICRMCHKIF